MGAPSLERDERGDSAAAQAKSEHDEAATTSPRADRSISAQ